MRDELFGVTGATGQVGGRVAARLAARGARQRLIVRDPRLPNSETARITDYGDGGSVRAAVDGVTTMVLVSASEHPERIRLHITAVDAVVAAGVARIVYVSFLGGRRRCRLHARSASPRNGGAHPSLGRRLHVPAQQPLSRLHPVVLRPRGRDPGARALRPVSPPSPATTSPMSRSRSSPRATTTRAPMTTSGRARSLSRRPPRSSRTRGGDA
jgi:hypothetical protein